MSAPQRRVVCRELQTAAIEAMLTTMPATLKSLPRLAKAVLVACLLCAVVLAQTGYAQPPVLACAVDAAARAADEPAAPAEGCQHCCAAKTCCLVSKSTRETAPRPEPLSTERTQPLDHAVATVTFTLVSSFDFLALSPVLTAPAGKQFPRPFSSASPRSAVSCIWLI